MAATLALKQTTAARDAQIYASGAGYTAGRTLILYINGNYMDAKPTDAFGSFAANATIPSGTPTGAAKPVLAEDNTTITSTAAATITVT